MAASRSLETDQPVDERAVAGMAMRLGAGLMLAIMFAGVKWAAARGVNVIESLFYRQVGTTLAALAMVPFVGGFASLRSKRVGRHVTRMAVGVVAMGLNFLSFTLLPMAEATAIGFSVPVFSTLLAAVLLGEQTGPWRWGAVTLGFAGVMIVVQPAGGHIATLGALVALTAALSTAGATIAIRHLGATEAIATTVFWFGASSLVPLSLVMPFVGHAHPPPVFAVLAVMAVAGGLAQLLLTGALRYAPVSLVMPMDYAVILWTGLFGYWLFGQAPSHWTWIGAPIVIAAGLVILWREQRRRKAGGERVSVSE